MNSNEVVKIMETKFSREDALSFFIKFMNEINRDKMHYSEQKNLDKFSKFLISLLNFSEIENHLKENKDPLKLFISLIFYSNSDAYEHYLKIKNKNLFNSLSEFEFYESTGYYLQDKIHFDYMGDIAPEKIKTNFYSFIKNKENKDEVLYIYINYILEKEILQLSEIVDFIFKLPEDKQYKLKIIKDCWCWSWREKFISVIHERKEDFYKLIKDDIKYIKNSSILLFIINVLRDEYINCRMISSGYWVTYFKETLKKYEFEEIKEMLKVFRKEFPHLFETLYVKNKCIRKSKKGEIRGNFEKLLIEINLNNEESEPVKKRRI